MFLSTPMKIACLQHDDGMFEPIISIREDGGRSEEYKRWLEIVKNDKKDEQNLPLVGVNEIFWSEWNELYSLIQKVNQIS